MKEHKNIIRKSGALFLLLLSIFCVNRIEKKEKKYRIGKYPQHFLWMTHSGVKWSLHLLIQSQFQ